MASFLLEERSLNIQILNLKNKFYQKILAMGIRKFLQIISTITVLESKAITYAVLQPEMLIDAVESNGILEKL